MNKRVWIVGTVSWDTVIYISDYPLSGGFAQSGNRIERLGGSAANIAQGLATAEIETGLITYLGNDDLGIRIQKELEESEIKHLEILNVSDNTSHALVVIDKTGERTVFALSNNYLPDLSIKEVGINPEDIVVFPMWRPYFSENLQFAKAAGAVTVVGLEALEDLAITSADFAIGSFSELPQDCKMSEHLAKFPNIVVTHGSHGSTFYNKDGDVHQSAFPAEPIDTTGAGDSYLAGFLSAIARDVRAIKTGMEVGSRWAAAMVGLPRSIPPNAHEVPGLLELLAKVNNPKSDGE